MELKVSSNIPIAYMYYFISILFLPIWNTVLCVIIEFSSYSFLFDFLLRWISLFYKIKVCFSFCSSSSHEIFTLFMLSSYFHVRIVTFMLSIRFLSSCVIYRASYGLMAKTGNGQPRWDREDWFRFASLWCYSFLHAQLFTMVLEEDGGPS